MFINSSAQNEGEKARLVSPIQDGKTGRCLYFWYHAYGPGIVLKLKIIPHHLNNLIKTLNLNKNN